MPARLTVAVLALLVAAQAMADVSIESAYLPQPAPGQANGAIYMRVQNTGDESVTLVSASIDQAQRAQIHEHQSVDGMMRMRHVEALEIPAGDTVEFRPHGYHLMVFGIESGLQPGETLPFCLHDQQAQTYCSDAVVRALGE